MFCPTNGLKGILGLIALAYLGYLVVKVTTIISSGGGLDAVSALSYGVSILAFGGMVYASFAINAYRFSTTPVYYVTTTLLMAQLGWYGYLKAVVLLSDMSAVAVTQATPVVLPPKPVPVPSPPPAPSHLAVVTAPPPPPKTVDNSPWPTDVPSGPVMITPEVTKYLNSDHIHTVMQPTPVPNMATTKETADSATATH